MEILCVLVAPRRKLAGRLAIMKKSLHFFAESFVEGTGGSSVLKTYGSSGPVDECKPEHSGGPQRQKFQKGPTSLNVDPENIDMVNGDKYQKQHKSIKRHRWWNIFDVLVLCVLLAFYCLTSYMVIT